jgi:Fur family zinc uptake transcriptional regulator
MIRLRYDTIVNELERRCAAGGYRLTALRRQVLGLLLESGGQATAYELISALPSLGRRASPTSVYRSLEFLIQIGFVRHLSSNNTFILSDGNAPEQHKIFVVCTVCGATETLASVRLTDVLFEAVESAHYQVRGGQTEVSGICGACQRERNVQSISKAVVESRDTVTIAPFPSVIVERSHEFIVEGSAAEASRPG